MTECKTASPPSYVIWWKT